MGEACWSLRVGPSNTIQARTAGAGAVMRTMSSVSRLRFSASVKALPRVNNGLGVAIVSTPKGVMADHEAKSQNLGGEVVCRVF